MSYAEETHTGSHGPVTRKDDFETSEKRIRPRLNPGVSALVVTGCLCLTLGVLPKLTGSWV